jgi:hypothetical protein
MQLHLRAQQHARHARIRCLATTPIEYGFGVCQELLATLENARLSAYHGQISRMGMQIGVTLRLCLRRIELDQLFVKMGHIAP